MTDPFHFAYVGSRTNRARKARGAGITVFAPEAGGIAWRQVQVVDAPDPSFLAFDSGARRLYAVEGDGSMVRAYARSAETGELTLLNERSSHGKNGVHVVIDPSGKFAVVTNHLNEDGFVSNLAVFPVLDDGSLGDATDVHEVSGDPGPNRKEQPYAKPHHSLFSPNGRFLAMADKGLDEIRVYALDGGGKLHQVGEPARLRWGCGPRHIGFHPNLPVLYILDELDSTIITADFDSETGKVTPRQIVASTSDAYTFIHRASEIEVSRDGRFVYCANRGQDTIGVFAADPVNGSLTGIQWAPSGGRIPRHFAFSLDQKSLYAANEFSHTVVGFSVGADGRLEGAGVVATPGSPTCVLIA